MNNKIANKIEPEVVREYPVRILSLLIGTAYSATLADKTVINYLNYVKFNAIGAALLNLSENEMFPRTVGIDLIDHKIFIDFGPETNLPDRAYELVFTPSVNVSEFAITPLFEVYAKEIPYTPELRYPRKLAY